MAVKRGLFKNIVMSLEEIKEQYAQKEYDTSWANYIGGGWEITIIDLDQIAERYAQQRVNEVLEEIRKEILAENKHYTKRPEVQNGLYKAKMIVDGHQK